MVCVPEGIREEFVKDGFSLILVPNNEWTTLFDESYDGIFSPYEKAIYIRIGYYGVILHEFGHYVHSVLQEKCNYDISTQQQDKACIRICTKKGIENNQCIDKKINTTNLQIAASH